MKKRVLLGLLCAVSCSVWAQQPSGGGGVPGRTPRLRTGGGEGGAPRRSAPEGAPEVTPVVEPVVGSAVPVAVSPANQDHFNGIMNSFSDLAMKFSEENASDLEFFTYECQHIGGEAFSRAIEPFLSVNGEVSPCADSDLVVIADERDRIEKLKAIAASIDRPIRQVLVSASVVEFQITDGFEKDMSLQYNQFANMDQIPALPGGGTVSGLPSSAFTGNPLVSGFASRMMDAIVPKGGNPAGLNGSSSYLYYDPEEQAIFSAFLTFLERNGSAQILSSPSLILRRGHTGNILSGEDIPITKSNVGSGGTSYSVDYKSVGIKLRVTPQSIFDERVVLEVSPEVSNIIRYEESAAGRNPVVAIRNANTLLEMNDGYMVSIGGLLREEEIKNERRIPILGSIPLLGTLFRASSNEKIRSQLVIFLSVKIVNPDDLTLDTIDGTGAPEELRRQIDATRAAFPVEKPSFFGGFKRLFQ